MGRDLRLPADAHVVVQPNRVWVTDLTKLKKGEGKMFLCVLKDLYDDTVVGWKTKARPTAELVVATIEWALAKSGFQFRTRTEATARINHYFMTETIPGDKSRGN
ncbi:MAG: transposase family protein [Gammaproteobacteria bacterium]|nr:DDE-type integrase/transposase/recombinase [Gammaproteobacteria bacterium]MXX95772.1 transposase family protein [Gammaproteobacteria bacterium]MYK43738.1 transposase family protein [Gammaproteobacteria bacterium]